MIAGMQVVRRSDDLNGINLPPTREHIRRLLELDDMKYEGEIFLFVINYNPTEGHQMQRTRTNGILQDEFKLWKIQPDDPQTATRESFIARITGTRSVQRRKVRELISAIKARIAREEPVLHIASVHILAAIAFYYGEGRHNEPQPEDL